MNIGEKWEESEKSFRILIVIELTVTENLLLLVFCNFVGHKNYFSFFQFCSKLSHFI